MWMYVYKLELLTFCYLTNINAILLTLTPFVRQNTDKREETNITWDTDLKTCSVDSYQLVEVFQD